MADLEKNGKVATLVVWGLIFSFNLSLITLIFYIVDLDLPDEALFLLLSILRYSSIFVCICSVYLLIAGIRRLIRQPNAAAFLNITLFLCAALYGSGVIIFNAFIVTIARGN